MAVILPIAERGRINIREIRLVESVNIKDRGGGSSSNGSKPEDSKHANAFQIGYRTHTPSAKNTSQTHLANTPEHTLIVIAR